jgi:hypothetical protein
MRPAYFYAIVAGFSILIAVKAAMFPVSPAISHFGLQQVFKSQ